MASDQVLDQSAPTGDRRRMILFLTTPPRWTPDVRPTVRARFRSALGAVVTTARRARS